MLSIKHCRSSSAVMVKETTPLPVISPEMRSAGGAFSGAIPSWSMGPAKAEPEMRMLVTLLLELGGKHENQQFQACCMESAPDLSSGLSSLPTKQDKIINWEGTSNSKL